MTEVDDVELLFILKILGIPIPVELVDYKDDDDEVTFGHYDSTLLAIQLNKSASHLHQRLTLVHEIVHVVEDLLGLELEHKDVYAMSQAIYGLLLENRRLVKWLLEDKPEEVVYKHRC